MALVILVRKVITIYFKTLCIYQQNNKTSVQKRLIFESVIQKVFFDQTVNKALLDDGLSNIISFPDLTSLSSINRK